MRAGVVADNVAETDEVITAILLGVGRDSIERLEIRVYVAEDGEAHDWVAAILGERGAGLYKILQRRTAGAEENLNEH
jgi:hypothetical protein